MASYCMYHSTICFSPLILFWCLSIVKYVVHIWSSWVDLLDLVLVYYIVIPWMTVIYSLFFHFPVDGVCFFAFCYNQHSVINFHVRPSLLHVREFFWGILLRKEIAGTWWGYILSIIKCWDKPPNGWYPFAHSIPCPKQCVRAHSWVMSTYLMKHPGLLLQAMTKTCTLTQTPTALLVWIV